jgi:hypothetical protein
MTTITHCQRTIGRRISACEIIPGVWSPVIDGQRVRGTFASKAQAVAEGVELVRIGRH